MPHLRIRGLGDSAMKDLSRSLPKELAKIVNTAEDNFTVEKIATVFFRNGNALNETDADPMIEFLWFDRGADVRTATAKIVTDLVRAHSKSEFISVVFTSLQKDHYFENAEHF